MSFALSPFCHERAGIETNRRYGMFLITLLQQGPTQPDDLTLNWVILAVLLVIAAILGMIVIKRRMREQDDDFDIGSY
jgi:hypothetical protein